MIKYGNQIKAIIIKARVYFGVVDLLSRFWTN